MDHRAIFVFSECWKRHVQTREDFLTPFCHFLFEGLIRAEENNLEDPAVLKRVEKK
jgi:hypothetical protein